MCTIALLPHTGKPQALQIARCLIPRLQGLDVLVCTDPATAAHLGVSGVRCDPGSLAAADAAIVLGGDGALLRAAKLLYGLAIPILGVNLGHMGFLTQIEPQELDVAVPRLLRGDYTVEERLVLEARVMRAGACQSVHRALNDVVIARGTLARMVSLEASVETSPLGHFVGDGLIVATPTGSTAYSLSAGGPIVHPAVDCMIVTPICAHTLGARAVVVRSADVIRIRARTRIDHDEPMLTTDGQPGTELLPGDEVWVGKAACSTKLVRLKKRTFYDVLGVHMCNPGTWGTGDEGTSS